MVGIMAALACGCRTAPSSQVVAWRPTVHQQLPVLGHRNWIVVADSAYPAQTSPGVQTVYTGAKQLEVLKAVLAELDQARHVQPIVHLDAELEHVPEALAPGVEAYRAELKRILNGRKTVSLPHEQLIAKLDEAGKTFHILLLKTDLTIPYTSVFMQLDCGYWGPESEKKLREAMSEGKP
jgi:L-fucose mutarotase/ribose pyranase (RbsD/FucU family)